MWPTAHSDRLVKWAPQQRLVRRGWIATIMWDCDHYAAERIHSAAEPEYREEDVQTADGHGAAALAKDADGDPEGELLGMADGSSSNDGEGALTMR